MCSHCVTRPNRFQHFEAVQRCVRIEASPNKPRFGFSSAISACSKAQACEQALRLLQEMLPFRLEPDTNSCNPAISSCEKGCLS